MKSVGRIKREKEHITHIDWLQPASTDRSEAMSGALSLRGPPHQKIICINIKVPLLHHSLDFPKQAPKQKDKEQFTSTTSYYTNQTQLHQLGEKNKTMYSVEKNDKPKGGFATPNDPQEDKQKKEILLSAEGEEKPQDGGGDATRSLEEGGEGEGQGACCAGQKQQQHVGGGLEGRSVKYINRRGGDKAGEGKEDKEEEQE